MFIDFIEYKKALNKCTIDLFQPHQQLTRAIPLGDEYPEIPHSTLI